ncbi:MAG: ABC transporter substrate-binding protein [Bacteroidia bacterium]|nr:ABC transporter substrate-binding protein [Bacteroidia bacterium]
MKKILFFFSSLALVGTTFIACNSEHSEQIRSAHGDVSIGGKVVVPGKAFKSLLPYSINDLASAQAAANVLECLTKISTDGKVLPSLAESFESDTSNSSFKFVIRKGVFFHDDACFSGGKGRELNAADVKYSLELLCSNSPNNSAFNSSLKNVILGAEEFFSGKSKEIEGVKLVDNNTILIKTLGPNEALPLILSGIQTAIVPKEAVERYGDKATIGTGPFLVKSSDGAYKLVRNPNYYGKDALNNQLPYLDEVEVKQIDLKSAEIEQLLKSELDVVFNLNKDVANQVVKEHLKDFEANGAFVMESTDEVANYDEFIIRKANLKGFKLNPDRTVFWAQVQKLSK